ncbi:MAG TPA: GTP-binding protein EngB [Archaeoglobaceae archaeon]|nr:GTP-binding protein EngB [Archaeoglobaceae archaeon]
MDSGPFNHEIIFVGRSNVGKSTLFSNLFGLKVRKGRKPGTTIKPSFHRFRDLLLTDMPGFGYIRGVDRKFNEKVKDFIVNYIEYNCKRILVAVQVIDAGSFIEIVDRWEKRGEIPVDVEMFEFLREVTNSVVAVNKIDTVKDIDATMNGIVSRLGLELPWSRWSDIIIPISAKNKDFDVLKKKLKKVLIDNGRSDLVAVFR